MKAQDLGVVAALLAACLWVYGACFAFDFVGYDDEAYVTLNAWVQRGLDLEALRWALTGTTAANWHPLTLWSHMLDVQLFGLDARGHHAVNVLLHCLVCITLFFVLRSATRARFKSALVALLFAVHPLHVEVVAWVSQRKTLLCILLGLLATGAYLRFVRSGKRRDFVAVLLLLSLGLSAKAMLVTLPLLLLLLDYAPLRRFDGLAELFAEKRSLLGEKLLLFIPVGAAVLLTWWAQRSMDAIAPLRLEHMLAVQLPNLFLGLAWYVSNLLWPTQLAVHYPHPYLPSVGGVAPAPWELPFAIFAVLGVAASVWVFRRQRFWVVGVGVFAVALLPVIGLVQVGTQAVADRYAYGPSIGFFSLVVWGGARLQRRLALPIWMLSLCALLSVAALAAGARAQTRHWRNSETLYTRAVEVSPTDLPMLFNLANVRGLQQRYDEAEVLYRRTLEIHPGFSPTELSLAELLLRRGRVADAKEARRLFESVLLERPHNRRAKLGLKILAGEAPISAMQPPHRKGGRE